ncbi:MAG: cytochrome c oxidase subunit II [Candidatus Pedobacter colombiensis]|uniref:Cytochrome c oxidase subunit 2 n=1 Tax=Candidatus Pedobacter colombiensis TaxID=3121371 RepID=A0AAJ5WDG7_9SPHI|nr:cytochrome c oxidase subunit II [Pedobacter sp.]WEK21581.1 MAG: cytochrome c oxidase subunit II [Pedobacter sp.]
MAGYLCLISNGQSIFEVASPEAEKIRALTYGFLIAAAGVMLLIVLLTIYISVKFRAKATSVEPIQIKGNRKVEILMVGFPLVLVIGFFFWSIKTMREVLPPHGDGPPDIIITGHQWWWEAVYPGSKVVAANEIYLPTGKRLLIELNAADVIHDWWVPALGGKMDLIPGMVNHLWVTINKPGTYEGTCSEFCGQQHAWMRIRVVAQSPEDHEQWLQAHSQRTELPMGTLALEGKALFMKASCSNCHSVQGTIATGGEGPDLTHFASRKTMLAGMMDNNPENVYKWLTDPQKVKPGSHMPRFIFAKDSIAALTAYLTQLK